LITASWIQGFFVLESNGKLAGTWLSFRTGVEGWYLLLILIYFNSHAGAQQSLLNVCGHYRESLESEVRVAYYYIRSRSLPRQVIIRR